MRYSTKYGKRKTLEIKIDAAANIIVSVPLGYPKKSIDEFVRSREDWIIRSVKSIRERKRQIEKNSNSIKNGGHLCILGKRRRIRVEMLKDQEHEECVRVEDAKVVIRSFSRAQKVLKSHVETHLREMARRVIAERIGVYEKHIPVKHNMVRIKNQKTRWGSCSSKKNLNFNFRIIMAPIEIVDYIVVHELCHLVHMNHSKDFWRLVGSIIPDYEERKKWLRENGPTLEL